MRDEDGRDGYGDGTPEMEPGDTGSEGASPRGEPGHDAGPVEGGVPPSAAAGPGGSPPPAGDAPPSGGSVPPGAEAPPGSGQIPPGPPPGGRPRPGLPWEVREQAGPLPAALQTLRMALLEPTRAFRSMRQRGQLGDAIVFLLIFGTLGAFFGLLWQSWSRAIFGSSFGADLGEIAALNMSGVFMLLITPVIVLVGSLIYAVIAHVMLLLFGGAPQPLETTWKVVCYGTGAPYIFNVLPFCGGLISFVWAVVVVIVGLREAQEVPGGRAAAAVLVPILFCCACAMLAVVAAISMGVAVAGLGG